MRKNVSIRVIPTEIAFPADLKKTAYLTKTKKKDENGNDIFESKEDLENPKFRICHYLCVDKKALDAHGKPLYGKTFTGLGQYIPYLPTMEAELKGYWGEKNGNGKDNQETKIYQFHVNDSKVDFPKSKLGTYHSIKKSGFLMSDDKIDSLINANKERSVGSIVFSPDKAMLRASLLDESDAERAKNSYSVKLARDFLVSLLDKNFRKRSDIDALIAGEEIELARAVFTNPHILAIKNLISYFQAEKYEEEYVRKKRGITNEKIYSAGLEIIRQSEMGGSRLLGGKSGNSCVSQVDFAKRLVLLLGEASAPKFLSIFSKENEKWQMTISEKIDGHVYIYMKDMFQAEDNVARSIARLLKTKSRRVANLDQAINASEVEANFALAPEQRLAVKTAVTKRMTIITGGPGTGKTTIVNFIRKVLSDSSRTVNILMCAPTGRAARRMTEATGVEALTVHNTLRVQPSETGRRLDVGDFNKRRLEKVDYIIVDEFSMIDTFLADAFFRCIDYNRPPSIIMIGDINQLPSVGAGNVLHDLIDSGEIPVVRLARVFRQGDKSLIAANADLVCNGHANLDFGSTFGLVDVSSEEEALDKIKEHYKAAVVQYGADEVSILSPYRKKSIKSGVESINLAVRDIANPPGERKEEINYGGRMFRVGDRVIRNKTKDMVANGDLGRIVSIKNPHLSKAKIEVDFESIGLVEYDKEDLDEISLAYATTIHKSQGSEYKVVIMCVLPEHKAMLQRNLFYTGITRAREMVIVVGAEEAIKTAINTSDKKEARRLTFLSKKIRDYMSVDRDKGSSKKSA